MKIIKSIKTLGIVCITSIIVWFTAANNSFGQANYTSSIGVPGANSITQGNQIGTDTLISQIIQTAVNWILGMLAMIVLLLLIYGGFQMVTAAGDEEQYGKWFTILKQAAFGLVMIWLAWFIVSLIFFLIDLFTP